MSTGGNQAWRGVNDVTCLDGKQIIAEMDIINGNVDPFLFKVTPGTSLAVCALNYMQVSLAVGMLWNTKFFLQGSEDM